MSADANLGDPSTLERIARARTSPATRPALDALRHRGFASLLRERERDARPYLISYDADGRRRELSHAAFVARVASRARTLAREAGVVRGDRVALLMHNDPEVPITCFAAWLLGATVVPANLGEDDERIRFVLENSRARAAVLLPDHAERAAALAAGLPAMGSWLPTDRAEAPASLADLEGLPQPEGEDECLIVYTSGTTGAPKGVLLTQQNLLVDARALADWNRLDASSRLMCVLPTHHVNGLIVTLVTPFLAGASVVLNRRFRTAEFWARIAAERVHVVSVVPTLLAFLLEEPEAARGLDASSLRHLICGAGPLTIELAARFEDRFGVRILHGYGLSETTCYSCMLPVELSEAEHRGWMREHGFPSIGVPLAPNEMAIHDGEGRELPPGERGEIVVRGVNVMRGYYGRPEANAETFAHGWFRSGDEGFALPDASGRRFFFITGRIKELIIRGGVNLSPFEIDEVLDRIPGVARGLAVGFENDFYGEEVGAYVQAEPGAAPSAASILAACRARLPFAKCPKVVVFGDEIPVTSTGKYQRIRLRPLFERWRGTQFRPGDGGDGGD